MQRFLSIEAIPILVLCLVSRVRGRIAPVGHTLPHSLHTQSHDPMAYVSSGVKKPSSPAFVTVGWSPFVGHTFMHCPHRLHSARKSASARAPGGRMRSLARATRGSPVNVKKPVSAATPNVPSSARRLGEYDCFRGRAPSRMASVGHASAHARQSWQRDVSVEWKSSPTH